MNATGMKMQESAKSRHYFLSLHMNLRPYSLSIWRFVLFLLDQSYCTTVKCFQYCEIKMFPLIWPHKPPMHHESLGIKSLM